MKKGRPLLLHGDSCDYHVRSAVGWGAHPGGASPPPLMRLLALLAVGRQCDAPLKADLWRPTGCPVSTVRCSASRPVTVHGKPQG